MFGLTDDLYIDFFLEDFDLPEEKIIEIMHKFEREQDPENFDFKLWEKKCREELKKIKIKKYGSL